MIMLGVNLKELFNDLSMQTPSVPFHKYASLLVCKGWVGEKVGVCRGEGGRRVVCVVQKG